MTPGVTLIAAERQRQIDREGWGTAHDDGHRKGELVLAALRYAVQHVAGRAALKVAVARAWPWAHSWWKPKSSIRESREVQQRGYD